MKNHYFIVTSISMLLVGCNSLEDITPPESSTENVLSESLRTKEDAIEIANNLFNDLDNGVTRSLRSVKNVETKFSHNLTRSGEDLSPEFYIVNYSNDGGFALVSADKRREVEVYAFSDSGSMSFSDTINHPVM